MTRIAPIGAVAASALALSVRVSLAATAGELDPSFDGDGKWVLPVRIDPGDLLAQPDGKVLLIGGAARDRASTCEIRRSL